MKTLFPRIPESPKAFKLAFSVLVLALAFVTTCAESRLPLSDIDLWGIVLYGAFINAFLLLCALLIPRSRLVANAVLALVVLGGVIAAHLVHTDLFFPENRNTLGVVCAAAGFALFIAFRVIDEQRWGGPALSALAVLGIGVIISQPWWASGARSAPTSSMVPAVIARNVRHLTFRETPNLYFISFDAIAPRALLRKHLGMADSRFHRVFDRHFRRFPNFFSNAASTKLSLNSILALDMKVLDTTLKETGWDHLSLFSGHQRSPLLEILHRNRYTTRSAYTSRYLGAVGKGQGPNIDHYTVTGKDSVCTTLLEVAWKETSQIEFWGYCDLARILGWIDIEQNNRSQVELLKRVADSEGPQFMMAHFYLPGHTNHAYRHGNEKEQIKFKSWYTRRANTAGGYLEEIVAHLKANDPDAILFVYGDHGPRLSQYVDARKNPEFVIQDLFGIIGGIYPRDRCSVWFDEDSSLGYMTTLEAVHGLLRCLSGGKSARAGSLQYKPVSAYKGKSWIPVDVEYDYGDFLYE